MDLLTYEWAFSTATGTACGRTAGADALEALSRAMTTEAPGAGGRLVGEVLQITPIDVLPHAPANRQPVVLVTRPDVPLAFSLRLVGETGERASVVEAWNVHASAPEAEGSGCDTPQSDPATPRA